MKVDVEGFEFEVLSGAGDLLGAIGALIVEVSLVRGNDDDKQQRLAKMIGLLTKKGFKIVSVKPSEFSTKEPWRPLEYNIIARR